MSYAQNVTGEEVVKSVREGFQKHVKPHLDNIRRHTYGGAISVQVVHAHNPNPDCPQCRPYINHLKRLGYSDEDIKEMPMIGPCIL